MPRLSSTDREVPLAELQAIWDACRSSGRVYNGCTNTVLFERYGDRVYHVAGEGWYLRPAKEAPDAPPLP